MAWPLVEVPNPFYGPDARPWNDLTPGSCWRVPLADADGEMWWLTGAGLSPEFRATGRDYLIFILLPGGAEWSPDRLSTESGQGWTVTGELPNITVRASVHQLGRYHGYVTDGILSDDLDGRSYPEGS